ncbi:MAG: four helix bundle protein [Roseiflexaceae bacterium]|nr:four helix bundle protein [Roseiflexaceae bacterium]
MRARTKAYALQIIALYSSLSKQQEAQILGRQMLRSGTSVGANYREGSRGRSDAEVAAKFNICIQELDETAYWIELLIDAQLAPSAACAPLLDETQQLTAMLTSAVLKLRRRIAGN